LEDSYFLFVNEELQLIMRKESKLATFLSRSWSRDSAILLLRLWLGSMMMYHGWGKVFGNIEGFAKAVDELGFPMPEFFAWAAALSEFGGGILLVFGLFTRPAAFLVAFTMFVAAFVHHLDDPFGKKEMAITYLVIAIALMIAGPGKTALDRILFGRSSSH